MEAKGGHPTLPSQRMHCPCSRREIVDPNITGKGSIWSYPADQYQQARASNIECVPPEGGRHCCARLIITFGCVYIAFGGPSVGGHVEVNQIVVNHLVTSSTVNVENIFIGIVRGGVRGSMRKNVLVLEQKLPSKCIALMVETMLENITAGAEKVDQTITLTIIGPRINIGQD